MRFEACRLFDAHEPCGAQANMAKLLAADASWEAANACLQFHGGFGFANEYDVERKFRETRLYQVAPISTNLILSYVAEHILGLPAPSDDDKRLPPHLSAELAAFAAGLRYEDIPAPVLRRAEDLLLDCLASILAGASAPAVLAIERYAAAMGPADGPSEC